MMFKSTSFLYLINFKQDSDKFHLTTSVIRKFNSNLEPVGNKYMLFAGWEVRIVKNCDRGLENAAQGRRPRAAFSRPRSQFFTIRTDLSR